MKLHYLQFESSPILPPRKGDTPEMKFPTPIMIRIMKVAPCARLAATLRLVRPPVRKRPPVNVSASPDGRTKEGGGGAARALRGRSADSAAELAAGGSWSSSAHSDGHTRAGRDRSRPSVPRTELGGRGRPAEIRPRQAPLRLIDGPESIRPYRFP
ncbi:Hypothetical protein NTJ_14348 [Nesidiocoris tenuis]|uniref:Uncharacterized protein n=1 Tax=Nesidiocoris tenuis TaxID=355587 RepID=A0ABN7BAW3_9HEMI|nr:Hypothetical protein NTJ_14348 [Nesidiocoris tenuis]